MVHCPSAWFDQWLRRQRALCLPEFLEAIADPKHERHADLVGWIGGVFDPTNVNFDAHAKALAARVKKWTRKPPTKRNRPKIIRGSCGLRARIALCIGFTFNADGQEGSSRRLEELLQRVVKFAHELDTALWVAVGANSLDGHEVRLITKFRNRGN